MKQTCINPIAVALLGLLVHPDGQAKMAHIMEDRMSTAIQMMIKAAIPMVVSWFVCILVQSGLKSR